MANQTLHTKHRSQNEQPILRNPTLSYTRCQKVLNFLDNRTQLLFVYGLRLRFFELQPRCNDTYAFVHVKQSGETTLYEKLNIEVQFFFFHQLLHGRIY